MAAQSNSPWSVKGVDPETREAAKMAARRAGLPIGAWLSQMIRAAAVVQLKGGPAPDPGAPTSGDPGPDSSPEAARGPGPSVPAPTMQALFDSIQKLNARLDAVESQTENVISPLEDKVDSLSRELDQVRGGGTVSTAPVERAMSRIAERVERLEEESSNKPRRGLFGRR